MGTLPKNPTKTTQNARTETNPRDRREGRTAHLARRSGPGAMDTALEAVD